MNWGSLLLAIWDDLGNGLRWLGSSIVYNLARIFDQIFLVIWSGLATIIDMIEGVFRKLAGVSGNGEVTDMATEIISHNMVQRIFGNLVAISAALLIFFTIIKIIQQQYKEKDGGNPYIIVFRMFKGMLMFFFVTAAVLVGIYASGVVFRALDDATKNGSASVSAQIFQAMAYDANLLRMGDPGLGTEKTYETAEEFVYAKVGGGGDGTAGDATKGDGVRYTMVELSGDSASDAQAQAWYDSLPSNHWGVVNADGSVTPMLVALANNTFIDKDKLDENLKDTIYDGDNIKGESNTELSVDTGKAHGSAGYKNDILSAVQTKLQPSIDVEWSPITILRNRYKMVQDPGGSTSNDVEESIMGNSFHLASSFRNVLYQQDEESGVNEKVEEPNVFSISLKGGATLQGNEASASFDLDVFSNQMPVEKIMMSIMANQMIVRLMNKVLEETPPVPLIFSIGPFSINLMQLAAVFAEPMIRTLLDSSLSAILYASGDGETVENPMDTIGNFVKIDFENAAIPVTTYLYELFDDENWEDLWKQVTSSWNEFKEQLNSSYEDADWGLENAKRDVDKLLDEYQNQTAWVKYQGIVNDYNAKAANLISDLMMSADVYNSLADNAENRPVYKEKLEDTWQDLVKAYFDFLYLQRKYYPNTSVNPASTSFKQIYLPIFEINNYNRDKASKLNADDIVNELEGLGSDGKSLNNLSFNVLKSPAGGTGNVFRIVDWGAYANDDCKRMASQGVADVYESNPNKLAIMKSLVFEKTGVAVASSHFPSNYKTIVQQDVKTGIFSGKGDMKEVLADKTGVTTGKKVSAANAASDDTKLSAFTATNEPISRDDVWQTMVTKAKAAKAEKIANGEIDPNQEVVTSVAGRDIITFRRTDLATQDARASSEIKALKKWCKQKGTLGFGATAEITPIYTMDADTLDYYMCQKKGTRRYLTEADAAGDCTSEESQRKYVCELSYRSQKAIKCLYDIGAINWVIGFMGVVVALGVYMNFTFGLIQRAVNMAVLYVMSPLTISFYPFDDGQRFNGNFVKPFYKETISAYSIIISLNIFFLLFTPVTNAVKTVTGGGMLMGMIAMIAFVSMLPKIRDTITDLLGAGSIQAKGINQMFSDAGKSLADPFRQTGVVGRMATKGALKAKDQWFKGAAGRREARDKKIADREAYLASGRGNWLTRSAARASLLKNKGLNAFNNDKKIADALAQGKDSEAYKNLNFVERMRANRIESQAQKQAAKDLASGSIANEAMLRDQKDNGKTKEERDAAAARLRELAARQAKAPAGTTIDDLLRQDQAKTLANDSNFQRGVNGVIASKVQSARNITGKVTGAVGNFAKAHQYGILGSAAKALFHPATGVFFTETGVGKELNKWFNPVEQDRRLKEMNAKNAEWRAAQQDIDGIKAKQATAFPEALLQGEKGLEQGTKQYAAAMQVRALGNNADRAAYRHFAIQKAMAEGKSREAAAATADKAWQNAKGKAAKEKLLASVAGDDALARYAADLALGVDGLTVDQQFIDAATKDIANKRATMSTDSLKASRKAMSGAQVDSIKAAAADFSKQMNLSPELSKAVQKAMVDVAKDGGTINDITDAVTAKLPPEMRDAVTIKAAMDSSKFATKLNKINFDMGAENTAITVALNYNKKVEKAREWAYEDMNVNIDSAEARAYFNAYRKMYDVDMAGGLHDEEKKLRAKFAGRLDSAEFKRELAALTKKYSSDFDVAFKNLGNRSDIRMHDYSVRVLEAERAERDVVVGKEWQKRMKYQLEVNMSPEARNIVAMDTALRKMKHSGDYTGAAIKMKEAVEAAIKKDFTALRNSGLDHETVVTMERFANMGDEGVKRLRSLTDYSDLTLKFIGDAEGANSSGDTHSARNTMAAIFRIVEDKETSDRLDAVLKGLQSQEGAISANLPKVRKKLPDDFIGETWDRALKHLNLTDAQGNKVTSVKDYVVDLFDRAAQKTLKETDPEWLRFKESFTTLASDWGLHKDLSGLNPAAGRAALNGAVQSITDIFRRDDLLDQITHVSGIQDEIKAYAWESSQKLQPKDK